MNSCVVVAVVASVHCDLDIRKVLRQAVGTVAVQHRRTDVRSLHTYVQTHTRKTNNATERKPVRPLTKFQTDKQTDRRTMTMVASLGGYSRVPLCAT